MKPELDITMTAVCRPNVVERTLQSLKENLYDVEPRLILHVDPVFEGKGRKPEKIVRIAGSYFPIRKYHINREKHPGLPNAISWCWGHATTEVFLTFEDDWILCRPLDAERCIEMMGANKELTSIQLDGGFGDGSSPSKFIDDAGKQVNNKDAAVIEGLCHCYRIRRLITLSPSFIRSDWAQFVAYRFKNKRGEPRRIPRTDNELFDHLYTGDKCLYTQGPGGLVKDIGRQWQRKTGKRIIK